MQPDNVILVAEPPHLNGSCPATPYELKSLQASISYPES